MGSLLTARDCADVLVVAITPRLEDGRVDKEGIGRNVEHLLAAGAKFLMPQCGTGLVYDSTLAEYEEVVGTFVERAGDRALVVPGIGPGYGRSLEMGRIARALGVAGTMIMPIVGPASAKGVRNGLQAIAEKVDLPTILYQRRLDIMPVEDVVALCQLDQVVGLKYAVDDLEAFKQIAAGAGSQAAMVCGMAEEPCIEYLEAGAVGFSSGMANFVPRLSLGLLARFKAGQRQEAVALRDLMIPFEDLRGENGARYSGSALHAGMECAGLAGGPVIPFAEDVAAEDRPRVAQMIKVLQDAESKLKEER